jgi:competence protein CoiA
MHLFAHDERGKRVFAREAKKQCDYTCIECGDLVRKRGGESVQDHFWHVKPRPHCSLNNKTASHLHLQNRFLEILPPREALLECRFPSIQRIADVAWITERIIFEVQYSPITKKEVMERQRDYSSVGWQVVWILHTKEFNKRKLRGAEIFLEEHPHYFSDVNDKGVGHIWDQLDIRSKGVRLKRLEKRLPLFNQPIRRIDTIPFRPLWRVHFRGDLIDAPPQKLPKKIKRSHSLLQIYTKLIDKLLN